MNKQQLANTASAMVSPGKGLLAMDESNCICNKRFEDVGITPTEENRPAYRDENGRTGLAGAEARRLHLANQD